MNYAEAKVIVNEQSEFKIKSEGYTHRYDFALIPSTDETFDPNHIVYVEPISSATECLNICLDLLRCVFGQEKVKQALMELDEADY